MQRESKRSVEDKAVEFAKRAIEKTRSVGRNRLPTVRELAAGAGVSLVTMWKAVQRLKADGLLFSAHGVGLLLDKPEAVPTGGRTRPGLTMGAPSERTVWAKAAARIERDILNRVFAPGSMLPSAKELQARYAVSYLTLRKALDNLESRGAVVPCKRGFALPPVPTARAYSRIVLLTARRFSREIESNELSLGILGQEHLRQLETECSQAGIYLDTYYYYQEHDRVVYCSTRDDRTMEVLDSTETLGFLWLITGTEVMLDIDVDRIGEKLAGYKKPVAVFSEITESIPFQLVKKSSGMRIFSVAVNEKPALAVSRFLLNLGHQRIAYISPFHRFSWSRARQAGLESTFAAAGYGENVGVFAIDEIKTGYFALDFPEADPAPLRAPVERWLKSAPVTVSPRIRGPFDYALRMALRDEEIERQLRPLFDQAMRDRRITAWVAANDAVALPALAYLRTKGTRIPQDLSLISFDNSVDATIQGITSFDFNLSACVTAMLAHLLRRTSFAQAVIEIDGWIVQRRTTGGAPKR